MPAVELRLRLSESALTMLDAVRAMKKDGNGGETSREAWCFRTLREVGGNWTSRWNLIHVHGHALVDPQGMVDLPVGLIPDDMPIGGAGASANVVVEMPDVILERLTRATKMNVAVRVFLKGPAPWATVADFATHHVHDAIALAHSQMEDQLEKGAVELMQKRQRLEAERTRRVAVLAAGGQTDPESSSESLPLSDPESADPSAGGSSPGG